MNFLAYFSMHSQLSTALLARLDSDLDLFCVLKSINATLALC